MAVPHLASLFEDIAFKIKDVTTCEKSTFHGNFLQQLRNIKLVQHVHTGQKS